MMRANIQAVSLKITGLKSTNAMAQAMKGVAKAMGQMNKQVLSANENIKLQMIIANTFLADEPSSNPKDHARV